MGKGSSSSASTPVISPNTLQSDTVAQFVDLISEGEIEGLVNGLQSVFFDNTPLQNPDGTFNYNGVTIDTRAGLPDQAPFLGFSDVETEVAVGIQVKNGAPGPIVETVTNPDATSLRVTIQIPALYSTDANNGNVNPYQTQIIIEVQPNGGIYTSVINDTIGPAKTTSPYSRSYRFPLPGSAPWNIRVTRPYPDDTTGLIQNQTFWQSYTVIEDWQLAYPFSALVASTVDAQSFGSSIPTRTFEIKGIKVSVPANYDPLTRIYATTGTGTTAGAWDGTFKTAWTDNPAWIFYDLIVNDRYGLGQFVDATQIDKFGLYAIAQYCDGLVPDGFGGMEPRYTLNGVIASTDDAMTVLTTVASVFRGMVYWGQNGVAAVADMPSDPVKLVTPANVIDGTINYSGSALKARHSVVFVTWYDPDNLYQPDIEPVEDKDSLALFGYREIRIVAFGCTSRGAANRYGRWLLDTEKNETEAAAWTASWDQADVMPGEIVSIADPAYSGLNFGGRVAGVGSNSLTLDRSVTLETGQSYTIDVVLADGTIASRPVTTGAVTTTTLSFDVALSPLPTKGAIWVLTSTAVAPRQFRVISRTESDKHLFDFTALFHDPTKYDRIELNRVLEAPSYTALPTGPIQPPTALTSKESIALGPGNVAQAEVTMSWTASPDARVTSYEVQTRPPLQNWQAAGSSPGVSINLFGLTAGDWGLRVRGVTSIGGTSPWLTTETTVIDGMLLPPNDITGVIEAYITGRSSLTWPEIIDLRPFRYEIRKGPNAAAALQVGDIAHPPFGTLGDGTYLVAAYIGPSAGPRTYSANWASIVIANSVLVENVVISHDEQAEGWPGTFSGSVGVAGPNIATSGADNILGLSNILAVPSIFNSGGQVSGVYTSPYAVYLGRVMAFRSSVTWVGTGAPPDVNELADPSVLTNPDILGAALTKLVDVYPVMRLSQSLTSDVLSDPSVLIDTNIFASGVTWGPWVPWTPDVQTAAWCQFGLVLDTSDPSAMAVAIAFKWTVDVDDRVDSFGNLTIPSAGYSLVFTRKGVVSPFIGGPNDEALPHVAPYLSNPQDGDSIVASNVTNIGCTLTVMNSGAAVDRTGGGAIVQGY